MVRNPFGPIFVMDANTGKCIPKVAINSADEHCHRLVTDLEVTDIIIPWKKITQGLPIIYLLPAFNREYFIHLMQPSDSASPVFGSSTLRHGGLFDLNCVNSILFRPSFFRNCG
jgi:hypothetical protein